MENSAGLLLEKVQRYLAIEAFPTNLLVASTDGTNVIDNQLFAHLRNYLQTTRCNDRLPSVLNIKLTEDSRNMSFNCRFGQV